MRQNAHSNRVGVMKQHGGVWWCPYCGRATVNCYRCSNYSCGKDLTTDDLDPIHR